MGVQCYVAIIRRISYKLQMTDYIPDPTKNFTPRQNAPKTQPMATQSTQSAVAIDLTDKAALEALALSTLVEIIQTAPRNISLVPAVRELLDRAVGKPAGSNPILSIGNGGEPMTVKVVFYNASDAPKESIKIIEN